MQWVTIGERSDEKINFSHWTGRCVAISFHRVCARRLALLWRYHGIEFFWSSDWRRDGDNLCVRGGGNPMLADDYGLYVSDAICHGIESRHHRWQWGLGRLFRS